MKISIPSQIKVIIRKGCIVFLWIMVWQCVHSLVGKDILIPSPGATFKKLIEMMSMGEFYQDILLTFYRVGVGVILSSILGVISALIAYMIKLVQEILTPFITLLKSTPVMAVIILALLWFTKDTVPIFVCFLMCYPVVYTNALKGFNSVDKELLEMAKVFKIKTFTVICKIYIPQIKPYLEAALEMIVGLSWKVVIAAEVLAVPKHSMGYNLLSSKSYLETDSLFSWVIVIVVLSALCEKGVNSMFKSSKR